MGLSRWLIGLLVLTFLTRSVFAAAPNICPMSTDHNKAHEQFQLYAHIPDTEMTNDVVKEQAEQLCCKDNASESNCMMGGCLLVMAHAMAVSSSALNYSDDQFTYAVALPQTPYFPLLIPPIA